MAKHNETGVKGEQFAVKHLRESGYDVLQLNWRFGHKEVDCIAMRGDVLVIVEIKTRTSFRFGFPEEAVGEAKQRFLKAAAEAFLTQGMRCGSVRFDVVSVLLERDEVKELRHIEDAFY